MNKTMDQNKHQDGNEMNDQTNDKIKDCNKNSIMYITKGQNYN